MHRDDMIARLHQEASWDVLIVGGGATGLGAAIDAAARGYSTLLLEMSDFAKATSSRSTKLVHGGVRYLEQGNISLVLEALHERGLLRQNAPHLVSDRTFVVPTYRWWEKPYYGIGMKVYDLLSGSYSFGASRVLSTEATATHLPTIDPDGLRGGVLYHDGQFDDARLAINMAQTAADQGATLVNYMKVTGFTRSADGAIQGVTAVDRERGTEHTLAAEVVINATGIFSDELRRMDDPEAPSRMRPSQGIHVVLDRSFLPGDSALMIPKTDDGRVLFAVPWNDVVIVGTTDTPVDGPELEPRATEAEVDFILEHTRRYLARSPTREDVLSVFAGIRPLVSTGEGGDTAEISRDHEISVSEAGLVTIAGGKWTTYRRMAEDVVDRAASEAGLPERPCTTESLKLHGHDDAASRYGDLAAYGADAPALQRMMDDDPELAAPIHEDLTIRPAQVVWAVRHEMARTVDDVLSRRTRVTLRNARAGIEAAPAVAAWMAGEMDRGAEWQRSEVDAYTELAEGYLADPRETVT